MISPSLTEKLIFSVHKGPGYIGKDAFTSSMFTITPHSCFINFPCRTAGSASGTYIQTETVLGECGEKSSAVWVFQSLAVSCESACVGGFNDASIVEYGDRVGDVDRKVDIVGDENDSSAFIGDTAKSCNALTAVSKSRPGVGSSAMMSSEFPTRAVESRILLAIPPESWKG